MSQYDNPNGNTRCSDCQTRVYVDLEGFEPVMCPNPECGDTIRCYGCGADSPSESWRLAPIVHADGIWCSDACVGASA